MQDFKYYKDPSPHVIIDDFLQPRAAAACLDEAIKLEPFYKQAEILQDDEFTKHLDECQSCRHSYELNRHVSRDNDILYLDETFKGKLRQSTILSNIHKAFSNQQLGNYLASLPCAIRLFSHCITTENLLSRYGKCDFYGWHTDTLPDTVAGRIITVVYYMNKEPEEFKGGELIIIGKDTHTRKMILPKHNRAIIFESMWTTHAVNTVKLESDNFDSGRFSLNCWLGFTGPTNIGDVIG